FLAPRPRLCQRRGVIEAAVDHRPADVLRLPNVLQWIAVDHDDVRELAGLERADVAVHAEASRAVQGRAAERLERREASLREHPDLPVEAEAIALAVGARVDADGGLVELLA